MLHVEHVGGVTVSTIQSCHDWNVLDLKAWYYDPGTDTRHSNSLPSTSGEQDSGEGSPPG